MMQQTLFQIFIHNPHQRLSNSAAAGRMEATQKSQEIAMLNINQRVTALAAGRLDPRSDMPVKELDFVQSKILSTI